MPSILDDYATYRGVQCLIITLLLPLYHSFLNILVSLVLFVFFGLSLDFVLLYFTLDSDLCGVFDSLLLHTL